MDSSEIETARLIPLEFVLEKFGAVRDPNDPKRNWKTPAGRITITENKFYNHDLDKGGGGAIDLTMHLGEFKFKEAISWLGGNVSTEAAISQYKTEADKHARRILETTPTPKLSIPLKDPNKLHRVKEYLINKRGIGEQIVNNAIEKDRLWADSFGNAVFSLNNLKGEMVGVELRGTYDRPYHGVRGEKGMFFTGTSKAMRATFVESSIEALSYQNLHRDSLVIGITGGNRDLLMEAAKTLNEKGFEIFDGFNNDKAGDLYAKRLVEALGANVKKDRPKLGKDWNEELRKLQEQDINNRQSKSMRDR